MATSSFEKNFQITTDEGLANFIEVIKGNPPSLVLHGPSRYAAEKERNEGILTEWLSRMRS